MQSAK
jgi:hypothetical protein